MVPDTMSEFVHSLDLWQSLKGFLNEKIVCPTLILVNHNYEISEKGVFGFAMSYLVLEIFRFVTYD